MIEKKIEKHNIKARIHWDYFSRNLLSYDLSDICDATPGILFNGKNVKRFV